MSRSQGKRYRSQRWPAGLRVALLLGCAAAVVAGGWFLRAYLLRRSFAWQIERGQAALLATDTHARRLYALDNWDRETAAGWHGRTTELLAYACEANLLHDARVRLLLARATGAEYGTEPTDWRRWSENNRRIDAGKPLQVPRAERVRLTYRWRTPVGLTAWFSNIIALDGEVFIPSLGARFDDRSDADDGVVRVRGSPGASEFLFLPAADHRGARDVLGLAASERGLFVACRNGSVYEIDAGGKELWSAHVGAPLAGPPAAIDANRDGRRDVAVVTQAGRVVMLNGASGRTLWVRSVVPARQAAEALGATLAVANVLADAAAELLVTLPAGDVAVLATDDGRVLWHDRLEPGTVAGVVATGQGGAGPRAFVADRAGAIWAIVAVGSTLNAVRWQSVTVRAEDTIIAAPRALGTSGQRTPVQAIVVCTTGPYNEDRGAACMVGPQGVVWRYPTRGAVWATPAVADLNGNGRLEVVVASVLPRADGAAEGCLTILSDAGHCLARVVFDAPLECAPVVVDLDGDGKLELLIADRAGWLHCFTTDGHGPVHWGSLGGDDDNTRNVRRAYDFGQRPFGYQRRSMRAP